MQGLGVCVQSLEYMFGLPENVPFQKDIEVMVSWLEIGT
jgi:hypothetical protein